MSPEERALDALRACRCSMEILDRALERAVRPIPEGGLGFTAAGFTLADFPSGLLLGLGPLRGWEEPLDAGGSVAAVAVREARAARIEAGDPASDPRWTERLGALPWGAVPLQDGARILGAIVVGPLAGESADNGVAPLSRLESWGQRVSEALGRIRVRAERDRALAGCAAVEEVTRACLSASRLDEVLRAVVNRAAEAVGAAAGALWILDPAAETLRLAASRGLEGAGQTERLQQATAWAQQSIGERRPVRGGRVRPEGGPVASFLCLPLLAFDEAVGAIALAQKKGNGLELSPCFTDADEDLLRLFGLQAAAAVHSARLFERVHDSTRRLREAERVALQSEKLAALGEMSAKLAHEIRNPLSAIGGFARRIEKALGEEDPTRAYASIIARETTRLEAMLTEQLQLGTVSRPRMSVVDVNAIVREAILLVREEIEHNRVLLHDECTAGLPSMLLDADRMKQVLLNILKNAAESTHAGDRIRVRTRACEGWVQVEVANNGERLPGDILEQLFVPFVSARPGGSGLGLALAHQIVQEHGGEIRVRTTEEWSAVFLISLPIRTNADRRRKVERRAGRDRRRAA